MQDDFDAFEASYIRRHGHKPPRALNVKDPVTGDWKANKKRYCNTAEWEYEGWKAAKADIALPISDQPVGLSELKACPFCAGPAAILDDEGLPLILGCDSEACRVTPQVSKDSKEEAIAAWNTRQPERESVTLGIKEQDAAAYKLLDGYWKHPGTQILRESANIVTFQMAIRMLESLVQDYEIRRRRSDA